MEKCSKCKQSFSVRNNQGDTLKCGFCGLYFHGVCQGIVNDAVLKYMCSGNQAIFVCVSCKPKREYMLQIANKIEDLQKCVTDLFETVKQQADIIKNQGEEIKGLKLVNNSEKEVNIPSTKRTISQVLQNDKVSWDAQVSRDPKVRKVMNAKENAETRDQLLVVKSKSGKDDAVKIKKHLCALLDPLKDPVERVTTTNKEKVIVHCKSKDDVDSVKQKLCKDTECAKLLSIERARNPVVKLIGIEYEMEEQELIERIRKQNSGIGVASTLNVVELKESYSGTFIAKIECDMETYKNLLERGKILIHFAVVKVVRCFDTNRCYKCHEYGHLAVNCQNKYVCPKCAGSHGISDCVSEKVCCANCLRQNKGVESRTTQHFVWSGSCPVLRTKIDTFQKKLS